MAFTSFNRTIWAGRLNANLLDNLVFGNVVNTDYEGDAANAATVKVNNIASISTEAYDGSLTAPADLTSTSLDLNIDQKRAFNFKVEDIDRVQGNLGSVYSTMGDAAYQLAKDADTYIAGLYTARDNSNVIGSDATPIQITSSNAYDYLLDLELKLNEANAYGQKWVVVPHFILNKLNKQIFSANAAPIALAGFVGNIGSLQVYASNNVHTTDTVYHVMAGVRSAIAFAGQISTVEPYRPEAGFSDALKGLYVFGAKVIKPAGIAVGYFTK